MGFLSQEQNQQQHRQTGWFSSWLSVMIVGIWSISIALGMVHSLNAASPSQKNDPGLIITQMASVDSIEPEYQLGLELYLNTCSTCHIPIPPQVFPTQTWQQIIQDEQHYGATLQPLDGPSLLLMWKYLQTYSRSIPLQEEAIPYRFNRSRYFKALHPRVEFSQPVTVNNCASCHPGASEFNYRNLTPEWENSP
ncbi:cytochrome C [Planktothrix mougeotii]|uniref:Cytochrome C n=1 Tax=Planktothrix mougeotii LEGE 06226 TaxID=1828728 RepID=A0ABR9UIN5_9CYAN|nr:cytochrome C [Planktothrix mougeotii]MBE9146315.1 cytochrome C [Planktothrix mougeotii LEGE 06226]